jgi:hypothetical protein
VGGKSEAPPAPDYGELATQQGQISSNLLQQQTTANRPDTTTPFGSTAWNYNPLTQTWGGSQTLTPQLQGILGQTETNAGQTAGVQGQELGQAGNLFNADTSSGAFGPINYSGVQPVESGNYYNPQAQNAVWNEFQTMEQPLQQQQTESQQSQLEGQGLRPGDAAYNTAMGNLSNTQYQQDQAAQDQAVLAGEQEAQTMQGMDVQAANAQTSAINNNVSGNLNLFNSLMGGGGTQPNYGTSSLSPTNAGVSQTPDLLGAQQQTYDAMLNQTNASNAASGSLWGGLGSILGTAASFFL